MPILDTIQAVAIPSFRSAGDALQDITRQRKLDIDVNGLFAPGSGAAVVIPTDGKRVISKFTIQNMGTNAVKIYVGPNLVTTNNFTAVLAGGNAQDDGLGSQINLDNAAGQVSVMADSGNVRLAVFIGYLPVYVAAT